MNFLFYWVVLYNGITVIITVLFHINTYQFFQTDIIDVGFSLSNTNKSETLSYINKSQLKLLY